MRLFAAFVLAPLSLAGQIGGIVAIQPSVPAAAPATQYAAEDICSVEGQLLNAATGEPVRRGVVSLNAAERVAGGPAGSVGPVSSNSEGRFAVTNVGPGKYWLAFFRTGFVSAQYAAEGSRRPGPLTLDRGRKLTGIVFKVTPQGAVAGRIVDENGDPVPYAQVRLARFQYVEGKKQLVTSGGSATSNDLGEYRIFEVPPGKYYLGVDYQPRGPTPQEDEAYVTTYFPSAAEAASAAPVEVGPGGQVQSVNVRLLRVRTVRVKGKVAGLPPSDRVRGISLTLSPRSAGTNKGASLGPQNTFEFAGVPPGVYDLSVTVYNQGGGDNALSAVHQLVNVGASNVSDLVVTLSPPVELSGRIRVEGTVAAPLKGLSVSLAPYDGRGVWFYGKVNDDLTFKFDSASPDRYRISITPLPAGYYLKTVRVGGVDVIDVGLDLTGGAPAAEIVLSADAGQVAGAVQSDASDHTVAGATVALIPQEKERRNRATYYESAKAGDDGRFAFHNLPPGEYKLFAWEEMEAGAYLDPEFVRPYESKGESVTVHEGDKLNVQVNLIPTESPQAPR